MRIGSLKTEKNEFGAVPVWIPAESVFKEEESENNKPKFVKVVTASNAKHIVWALDQSRNIYVREGVFPDQQIGYGWLKVMN